MKKRMVSVNPNEINNKIAEHMRKKCESLGYKENTLLSNKTILNKTPNQIKFVTKSERSNSKSPIKKMTFSYENSNNNNNNNYFFNNYNNNNKYKFNCNSSGNNNSNSNGYCLNLDEENTINNLSSRIEKYCNISKRYLNKNANNRSNAKSDLSNLSSSKKKSSFTAQDKKAFQSKSPLKFYMEQNKENDFTNDNFIDYTGAENSNFNSIFGNVNALNVSTCGATSIRKMFDFEIEKDKCSKENFNINNNNNFQNKFRAKPLNRDIFSKNPTAQNSTEIESFNSILEKSRQDKFALDKLEKEKAKKAKINEIKTSKFGVNKASLNAAGNNRKTVNGNNKLQMKRNVSNLNKTKIVDFNELMLTED